MGAQLKTILGKRKVLVPTIAVAAALVLALLIFVLRSSNNALDADRELFDAESSLAQTKRNESLSLVQLYKALGGGWQQ